MAFDWFGLRKSKPEPQAPRMYHSRRGPLEVVRMGAGRGWSTWEAARAASSWPVFLGADFRGGPEKPPEGSIEEILAKAAKVDIQKWIRERLDDPESEKHEDFDPAALVPSGSQQTSFRGIEGDTHLVHVPCEQSWMVPALLGYGGWNECPDDVHHTAMLRHWHERYGIVPVTFAGDVVELYAATPLSDPRAARTALGRCTPTAPTSWIRGP